MHTIVIAEIGSAWRFGDDWQLGNAYQAIDIAHACGADIAKFQWTSDPRTMEQRRNVPVGSYDILAWPKEWIKAIASYAEAVGIEFLATVFLPSDVEIMNPYVKQWKVASLENNSRSLFTAMRSTGKPIIASHGATEMDVASSCWGWCDSALHCTAAYPAPLDSLNLQAIRENGFEGYSDHSRNFLTGAIAVACGAKIVEVHFQLTGTPESNPDSKHSLFPGELGQYVNLIRQAELMLGDGIKRIMPCEEWALKHKVKA
jgi:sialic acid synthase SpsE